MHSAVCRLHWQSAIRNEVGSDRKSATDEQAQKRKKKAGSSSPSKVSISTSNKSGGGNNGNNKTQLSSESDNSKNKNFRAEISSHRAVAVVRLLRIELGAAFSDLISGDGPDGWEKEMGYVERTLRFKTPSLKPEGMRLLTEDVAGVIRWKKYLDYLIHSLSDKDSQDFDRMEPMLKQILRLGAFELLKLEMPAYAVVNEAVKLTNATLRPGAGKLVNALLRALAVQKDNNKLPIPQAGDDERSKARALATIHSHPVWMVRRWIDRYGREEAVKLMEWNNTKPTYGLRANNASGTSRDDLIHELEMLKVPFEKSPYLADFVRLTTGLQDVLKGGLIQKGYCTVQDESAGLVVAVLDPQPGDLVIDCCAAPGGKTLYIASRLEGKGKVIAVDINKARLRVLKEAAEKAKVAERVSVYNVDARDMIRGRDGLADRVLLDAPCSGLGVLSKRADLRWKRTFESLQELTELQDELLDGVAKMVKPGGLLVYSTCSIEPFENIDRVTSFLSRNEEFTLESAEDLVPKEMAYPQGCFSSLPHENGIDGAFAARLRRRKTD